jgi:hypothetical protein
MSENLEFRVFTICKSADEGSQFWNSQLSELSYELHTHLGLSCWVRAIHTSEFKFLIRRIQVVQYEARSVLGTSMKMKGWECSTPRRMWLFSWTCRDLGYRRYERSMSECPTRECVPAPVGFSNSNARSLNGGLGVLDCGCGHFPRRLVPYLLVPNCFRLFLRCYSTPLRTSLFNFRVFVCVGKPTTVMYALTIYLFIYYARETVHVGPMTFFFLDGNKRDDGSNAGATWILQTWVNLSRLST